MVIISSCLCHEKILQLLSKIQRMTTKLLTFVLLSFSQKGLAIKAVKIAYFIVGFQSKDSSEAEIRLSKTLTQFKSCTIIKRSTFFIFSSEKWTRSLWFCKILGWFLQCRVTIIHKTAFKHALPPHKAAGEAGWDWSLCAQLRNAQLN